MQRELGYSDSVVGSILSAFFFGYACTQVYGGHLATVHGGKPVLAVAVVSWSIMTIITPPAARTGLGVLCFVRFLMGLGEGMSLPCIHQLSAVWAPPNYKSRFITFVSSGMFMGTVVAMACSPIVADSWPSIFYGFGVIGLVWSGVWMVWGRSYPANAGLLRSKGEQAEVAMAEMAVIDTAFGDDEEEDDDAEVAERGGMIGGAMGGDAGLHSSSPSKRTSGREHRPWSRFFGHRSLIAIYFTHFTTNYLHYLLISWLPKFTTDALHVDLGSSVGVLILPYLATFVCGNLSGVLSDLLVARCGLRVVHVRKLMQTVAVLGPAFFLSVIISADQSGNSGGAGDAAGTAGGDAEGALSVPTVTMLLAGATGLTGFAHAGFWANVVDVSPACAGTVLGVSNTFGTFSGILANLITGWVLDSTGKKTCPHNCCSATEGCSMSCVTWSRMPSCSLD
jgi:ACS family sodium-dependent inorganic phosphate cotransporter